MPYPETCPECAGPFRNTGTHFTARRNEAGRKVMLELGCQNVNRRFWWDFTQGKLVGGDGRNGATRDLVAAQPAAATAGTNGHAVVHQEAAPATPDSAPLVTVAAPIPADESAEEVGIMHTLTDTPDAARATFLRQLELDRLMLRQMRGWLLSEEARRAAEVAVGATEAAYERLAIALFGSTLAEMLGPNAQAVPPAATISAEERLEQQREKARIRARQRRAALKRARES